MSSAKRRSPGRNAVENDKHDAMAYDSVRMAATRMLEDSPVLSVLPPDERTRLAANATSRSFARGATLFRAGDPATSVLVVTRGTVRLSRTTSKGHVLTLRRCERGEVLGQMSALEGGAHSVTAEAEDAVTALSIPRGRFLEALERNPKAALSLAAALAGRVRALSDEVEAMKFGSVADRVLARVRERMEGRRELRLTHAALATEVGASRENVSRVLELMERAGVIALGRGKIEVTDPAKLSHFSFQ